MIAPCPPAEACSVIDFWREVGPKMWFAKDPDFDRLFGESFLARHEAAARGAFAGWQATPEGALALVLLLDQYPRNAFRDTPRMYATDALAREVADAAIAAGHDRAVANDLAVFFYLPLGHSESLSDQERCVELAERLGDPNHSRQASLRHRPPVRPLSPSQRHARPCHDGRGAALSRRGRLQRLTTGLGGVLITSSYRRNVRFAFEIGHQRCAMTCRLWANAGLSASI